MRSWQGMKCEMRIVEGEPWYNEMWYVGASTCILCFMRSYKCSKLMVAAPTNIFLLLLSVTVIDDLSLSKGVRDPLRRAFHDGKPVVSIINNIIWFLVIMQAKSWLLVGAIFGSIHKYWHYIILRVNMLFKRWHFRVSFPYTLKGHIWWKIERDLNYNSWS